MPINFNTQMTDGGGNTRPSNYTPPKKPDNKTLQTNDFEKWFKSYYGTDYKGQAITGTSPELDTGRILQQYYNAENTIKGGLDTNIATTQQQTFTAQKGLEATYARMQKYLPSVLQQQGLQGLGVSQSIVARQGADYSKGQSALATGQAQREAQLKTEAQQNLANLSVSKGQDLTQVEQNWQKYYSSNYDNVKDTLDTAITDLGTYTEDGKVTIDSKLKAQLEAYINANANVVGAQNVDALNKYIALYSETTTPPPPPPPPPPTTDTITDTTTDTTEQEAEDQLLKQLNPQASANAELTDTLLNARQETYNEREKTASDSSYTNSGGQKYYVVDKDTRKTLDNYDKTNTGKLTVTINGKAYNVLTDKMSLSLDDPFVADMKVGEVRRIQNGLLVIKYPGAIRQIKNKATNEGDYGNGEDLYKVANNFTTSQPTPPPTTPTTPPPTPTGAPTYTFNGQQFTIEGLQKPTISSEQQAQILKELDINEMMYLNRVYYVRTNNGLAQVKGTPTRREQPTQPTTTPIRPEIVKPDRYLTK